MSQNCKILNGQLLANKILHQVRREIAEKSLQPALAVILVGDDPASKIYIKLKKEACLKCDIEFYLYHLPASAPEEQILDCLSFLNQDQDIQAIIVQLPLPKHLDPDKIIKKINPKKDADGFHPKNLSAKNLIDTSPPLVRGIIKLLKSTKENLKGKKTLILSNNPIFAKPFKHLLKKMQISSQWTSLKDPGHILKIKSADIVIIAIGQPKFLKAKMIKKDAIIIDVGCNLTKKVGLPRTGATCPPKLGERRRKRLVRGDVDFNSCKKRASWISPVPGGVGPITVAMLLANVVKPCKAQKT